VQEKASVSSTMSCFTGFECDLPRNAVRQESGDRTCRNADGVRGAWRRHLLADPPTLEGASETSDAGVAEVGC
jgi:hypothetical protein